MVVKSKRVKKQALRIGNPLLAVCYINNDSSRVESKESTTQAHTLRPKHTHTRRAAVTMLGH